MLGGKSDYASVNPRLRKMNRCPDFRTRSAVLFFCFSQTVYRNWVKPVPLERYQRWLQTLFRTSNLIPDGLIPYLKIRFQPIFKHLKNCTSSYRIKFYLNLILLGTKEKFLLQWRSTTLRQISLICEIAEIPQRCSVFSFPSPSCTTSLYPSPLIMQQQQQQGHRNKQQQQQQQQP